MKINGLMLTRGVDEKMFYVENLIKSIARQNVKPHEVIVAAGASGDPISEILDKYVHDVKHNNAIFLLEDDLYPMPSFMEVVMKAFEEYPESDCVYKNLPFQEARHQRTAVLQVNG